MSYLSWKRGANTTQLYQELGDLSQVFDTVRTFASPFKGNKNAIHRPGGDLSGYIDYHFKETLKALRHYKMEMILTFWMHWPGADGTAYRYGTYKSGVVNSLRWIAANGYADVVTYVDIQNEYDELIRHGRITLQQLKTIIDEAMAALPSAEIGVSSTHVLSIAESIQHARFLGADFYDRHHERGKRTKWDRMATEYQPFLDAGVDVKCWEGWCPDWELVLPGWKSYYTADKQARIWTDLEAIGVSCCDHNHYSFEPWRFPEDAHAESMKFMEWLKGR